MADQTPTGGPPADHDRPPVDPDAPRAVTSYQPPSSHLDRAGAGSTSLSVKNESAAMMLAAREAKAIEIRALMAERHPRNVDRFREGVLAACKRVGFADMAMYEKPVGGGKFATGLSIRFAEEAIRHWRNAEVAVSILAEDDDSRTLEAVAVDFENNIVYRAQARVAKFVWRLNPKAGDEILGQKTNSRGVLTYKIRADEDSLFTSERAAAAKASREVSIKLMPSDILEECEAQIEKTLDAIGGDPEKFLVRLVEKFAKVGVVRPQLEKLMGKDLSVANIAELRRLERIHNAIKLNETDWASVIADAAEKKKDVQTEGGEAKASDSKSGGERLKAAAKKPGETKAAPAPATPAAEPTAPAKTEAKAPAPAKTPAPAPAAEEETPAIATKDCVDCGALKGQPHESECPLA